MVLPQLNGRLGFINSGLTLLHDAHIVGCMLHKIPIYVNQSSMGKQSVGIILDPKTEVR